MTEIAKVTLAGRAPADKPLLGMTILVVEDSRCASEALRQLCQAGGARMRRADTLAAARRHLATYRPGAAVIDLGLPDGPGLELIAEMDAARPRVPVILATSGDDTARYAAEAAGADGFLEKPVSGIAIFQQALVSRLPAGMRPAGVRALPGGSVAPDPAAYRDDLDLAAAGLAAGDPGALPYLLQFLQSAACAAGDKALLRVARAAAARIGGGTLPDGVTRSLCADLAGRIRTESAMMR
ncbi:response regulator [Rhodovulum sp. YNF3179]|uniref:response regulator n=1 Tax=Rhodovulum sp. YNF3179 TaxID=3425127 RepID=UPI003D353DBA